MHKEVAPQPKNEGKDVKQNKQLTLTTCFNNSTPYPKTSSRFKACDEALAIVSFICSDMQPFSIIDSVSFIRFVQTLDPRYTMHSRNYYTCSAIPQKYEEIKALVKDDLKKAEHISATTDMWTGCHQRGYMSLSGDFIDTDWELKRHTLETWEITAAHDAENLAIELNKCFELWKIAEKIFTVTTDNAANIRNAVVNKLNLVHLDCVGHTLQLSIGKAFKVNAVARVLSRVRKLEF